jgi:hypothetical protein
MTPSSKAERLAVAGVIAPVLRESEGHARERRVALVNASGEVTGYSSVSEVRRSILLRARIELDVQPGSRPKKTVCERCGCLIRVGKTGKSPRWHRSCRPRCIVCRAEFGRPGRASGKTGRCVSCCKKKTPTRSCLGCGKNLSITSVYGGSVRCTHCAGKARMKPRPSCADCGRPLPASAMWPSKVAKRNGPPTCVKCRDAPQRAAERSERSKRGWAKRRGAA